MDEDRCVDFDILPFKQLLFGAVWDKSHIRSHILCFGLANVYSSYSLKWKYFLHLGQTGIQLGCLGRAGIPLLLHSIERGIFT